MNRIADRFANKAVTEQFDHMSFKISTSNIDQWQGWLTRLAVQLQISNNGSTIQQCQEDSFSVLIMNTPLDTFQNILPRWVWSPLAENYNWVPRLDIPAKTKLPASVSRDNWLTVLRFLHGCRWWVTPVHHTSILEIVFQAYHSGIRLSNTALSPCPYCKIFRKSIGCAISKLHRSSRIIPKFPLAWIPDALRTAEFIHRVHPWRPPVDRARYSSGIGLCVARETPRVAPLGIFLR